MTKVFVVTEGEYSDYGIVGVYSEANEDAANRLAKTRWLGRVEEYELDWEVDKLSRGLILYHVHMRSDGKCISIGATTAIEEGEPTHRIQEGPYEVYIHDLVWAKNKEHAAKIMNERRTVWMVTGRWPGKDADS